MSQKTLRSLSYHGGLRGLCNIREGAIDVMEGGEGDTKHVLSCSRYVLEGLAAGHSVQDGQEVVMTGAGQGSGSS